VRGTGEEREKVSGSERGKERDDDGDDGQVEEQAIDYRVMRRRGKWEW